MHTQLHILTILFLQAYNFILAIWTFIGLSYYSIILRCVLIDYALTFDARYLY